MADNKSLNISSTNFSGIKAELINFLRTKPEFDGFDFEGTNMSVLIDLLSYNTYYNNFYLNMVSSEMFLDTAQLRNSVVSHAKKLGYSINSVRGARAAIDITINVDSELSFITIPKWTKFESSIDNITYDFVMEKSEIAEKISDGVYKVQDVTLVQGRKYTHRFTVTGDSEEKFILPNENIDTSLMDVKVYDDTNDSIAQIYKLSDSGIGLNSRSQIYFINETYNKLFEISFGDGILGKSLNAGNIIEVDYIISKGSAANKASNFLLNDSIGYNNVVIDTATVASAGSEIQSIDSIKYNAPKSFQSNYRLVTTSDYETAIMSEYPEFDSVKAWGGEENEQPNFGKVYISIKPKSGFVLSNLIKEQIITNVIKPRSIVSVSPVIIEPNYLFINPTIKAIYNPNNTNRTASDIQTSIIDVSTNFSSEELEKFAGYFKYSTFIRAIDDVDGVINSRISLTLSRRIVPDLRASQMIVISFDNAILHPFDNYEGAVKTSKFSYNEFTDCFFDDLNGVLRIVRQPLNEKIVLKADAGTVDYVTGAITINDWVVPNIVGDYVKFTVQPEEYDIYTTRNKIAQILAEDVSVTILDENRI